jgi:UDP-N-acetylmuramoyl-L-alanyl-D-glutamate--2,6-diaminopimelate ligase
MLRHILASIFPQELVAELGTLGLRIWRGSELIEAFDTGFTTPEAPTLQHLCARLLDRSVRRLVMEVSSHALSLGRVGSVHFRSVGFTNLSQDHLDFHGSMEAYFDAKKSLFTTYFSNSRQPERWAVVHAAKPWGQRLVSELPLSTELHAFDWGRSSGFESQKLAGIEVWDYRFPGKFFAPVLGSFNAENALCALLMATRGGQIPVSPGVLTGFPGVPGRLERVSNPNGVNIVVDYAHTPDALQRSLQTLRHLLSADQKLWVVFGCGGDRDKAKRPAMGGIAESLADFVILTSDNPRSEDAAQILNEIRVGFKKWDSARHQSVADRRQAIGIALAQSDPKDLVLIAGRGHESVQEIQGVKVPFHDPTVARELLQTRA